MCHNSVLGSHYTATANIRKKGDITQQYFDAQLSLTVTDMAK